MWSLEAILEILFTWYWSGGGSLSWCMDGCFIVNHELTISLSLNPLMEPAHTASPGQSSLATKTETCQRNIHPH